MAIKHLNILVCVLFCTLISIPLLNTIVSSVATDPQHKPNQVGGPLKLFPFEAWPSDFANQTNKYLSQQLVFKKTLLDLYSQLRFKLLASSASKKALIGKQGWLYFSKGNGIINARGHDMISDHEALAWINNVLSTANVVQRYGGIFKVVIVPDKPQVYPEHLPNHVVYNKSRRRANKLIELSRNAGLEVIDLLPTLLENKGSEPLYDKSDTHWTHEGAYLAYLEIMRELNLGLPRVSKADLRVLASENYSGDLARLLNLQKEFGENHKILLAHTSYNLFPRKKQLLVLGDSFSGRLIDFWNYSFAKSTCRHHRWGNLDNKLLAESKAEVVLFMIVERGLQYPPQKHQINSHNCF